MITQSRLWDAQDALLAALEAHPTLSPPSVGVDLGFPSVVKEDHVWISGGVTGSQTHGITGPVPSDETFRLTIIVYTQLASDFVKVRDHLKTLTAAVESALASEAFQAVVPSWDMPEYRIDEGLDDVGMRQMSAEMSVECKVW